MKFHISFARPCDCVIGFRIKSKIAQIGQVCGVNLHILIQISIKFFLM